MATRLTKSVLGAMGAALNSALAGDGFDGGDFDGMDSRDFDRASKWVAEQSALSPLPAAQEAPGVVEATSIDALLSHAASKIACDEWFSRENDDRSAYEVEQFTRRVRSVLLDAACEMAKPYRDRVAAAEAALAAPSAPVGEAKTLTDDQIMEVIRECFPWQSEGPINDLLTYEKSPPLFPQATYDVPSYRATKFVRAIESRILSALQAAPVQQQTSQGTQDVLAERRRQIEAEGWTPEHDATHASGEIAIAAACYALNAASDSDGPKIRFVGAELWPWSDQWWKPSSDPRRDLVKAGALIIAEIDRLDRLPAATDREA